MNSLEEQHKYIIGSEWAYFKVYCGPVASERILVRNVYPLVMKLYANQLIDKFFFVRYSDPHPHLRLRFHLRDKLSYQSVVNELNKTLSSEILNRIIWKFTSDTYVREMSRYGVNSISIIETVFSKDSLFVLQQLHREKAKEEDEWLFELSYIYQFASLIFTDRKDIDLFLTAVSDNYLREFSNPEMSKVLLDKKYRIYNEQITKEIKQPVKQIGIHLQQLLPEIIQLKEIYCDNNDFLINLFVSIIHMHFNRVYKTEQRKYESVVYYFLKKQFKSMASRGELPN